MKRRDLLRRLAAAGTVGLAGCVADDGQGAAPDGSNPDPTPTETETPTTTPTATPTERPPSLVGGELVRFDASCAAGAERDVASVGFGDGTVSVTGAVGTSNPCYTAALEGTDYDADADELTVTVTVSPEGGACAQCVAVVEYEAAVEFRDGLPGAVTVRHATEDGTETVASVER